MSDRTIVCRDCGEGFTFTAGEQAFYQERGFSEPQRCADCRSARRAQRSASDQDARGSAGGYSGGGYSGGSSGGGYAGGYGGGSYGSGSRRLYPAVCSACGKETEVPFEPRSEKPVYCRECFRDRRPAAPRADYSSRY